MVEMSQGRPIPRKTLTAFDPVTLPTAMSAYSDCYAASNEAKVSGSDVPSATKVMAVTDSLMPIAHPKTVATSDTMRTTKPITARAMQKAAQPPKNRRGGTTEKMSFHGI